MNARKRKRGFVLLVTALCLIVMTGIAGLAIDLGRVYVSKHESQTYVDSASLAAALELDGTSAGFARAQAQLATNTNRWNFNTIPFSGSQISFSKDPGGPWEVAPTDAKGYRYTRVVAEVPVPLMFLGLFTSGGGTPVSFLLASSPNLQVRSNSASGQESKTQFEQGLFPFSPFAHNTTGPHFGLTVGQSYTMRWPATPKLNQNTCSGDNVQSIIDLANAGGGSERGYIEQSSADTIRKTIEEDYQTVTRTVGESVSMSGGAKQSQLTSLLNRIAQDSDTSSATYSNYILSGRGNGRRLVGMLVNTGYPNYTAVQIGAFFLARAADYDPGNRSWCAEYIGAWVQGSKHKGAGYSGAYVAKLVQ